MSFRDMLAADGQTTFVNDEEYGEKHDIRYDGKLYEDVPCTITRPKQKDRNPGTKDHGQGIYLVTNRFHCPADTFGGTVPEQGTKILIRDSDADFWRAYYVAQATSDPGMINIDLEALEE